MWMDVEMSDLSSLSWILWIMNEQTLIRHCDRTLNPKLIFKMSTTSGALNKGLQAKMKHFPIWSTHVSLFVCIIFCILLHRGWIQPDNYGCKQNFVVIWTWNQLRIFWGIFKDNFEIFKRRWYQGTIFFVIKTTKLCCLLSSFLLENGNSTFVQLSNFFVADTLYCVFLTAHLVLE